MTIKIDQWNYAYCQDCKRIRYRRDLSFSNGSPQCAVCGSNNLESPGWVQCPYHRFAAVVCPRSGKGLRHSGSDYSCDDYCSFRT